MTDTYLRSLGFAPLTPGTARSSQLAFGQAWRYQHDRTAADGTPLFIEHPLGIDQCRLSALPAPLAAGEVFASVGLHDRPALEAAIASFYVAHAGKGALLPAAAASAFQPFRHQL